MTIGAVELARLLDLPEPTDEQAAVIEADLVPAAVVAGAGSGKTETMAARVVWLVANERVRPEQVLGLTFTRKAAAELGARIRRRLAQWRRVLERTRPDDTAQLAALLAGEPTVSTYAAYAGRLVGEHALRVGAEPDARLLSPALLWQLADTVVRRWEGPLGEFGAISSLVQWVIATAGQFADHLADPDVVARFCDEQLTEFFALPLGPRIRSETPGDTARYVEALAQRRALVPLVHAFATLKQQQRAVDFGDQMRLAAALAGLPEVAAIERDRYRTVLLDEYQDTGHAQVEMLRGLFGAGHPVTAVGDPFQSIYGWRGASAGTMGSFDVTFPDRDGTPAAVHPLATSFRNDRSILDAANAVAAPLRTSRVTVPLRARAGCGDGTVAVTFVETVEQESAWVAQRMLAAWQALPAGGRTAAVLVRRRSQIPVLADALRQAGLPVEIVGLGGLLTTPEVVDVVATLRVLGEHRPGGALMRLLTGARWRIGPRDLALLHRRAAALVRAPGGVSAGGVSAGGVSAGGVSAGGVSAGAVADDALADNPVSGREPSSLTEALDDLGDPGAYSPEGYRRMARLGGELRRLRRRLAAPLAELVAEVEHAIGVDVEVAARPDRASVGRVHLDRFLDVAADFAAEAGDASLRAFLAYLDAAEDEENGLEAGEVEVAADRVQILTVHGAKGLEWDVVAVPGLVVDVFPGQQRGGNWARSRHELPGPLRGDATGLPVLDLAGVGSRKEVDERLKRHADAVGERFLDEERRLAYVALTRARSTLLASGYAWDTTRKPRVPSPYLLTLRELVAADEWFVPDPDAVNPRTVAPISAEWPIDPLSAAPGGAGRRRGSGGSDDSGGSGGSGTSGGSGGSGTSGGSGDGASGGPGGTGDGASGGPGGTGGRRAAVESGAALVRAASAAAPGQTLSGLVLPVEPAGSDPATEATEADDGPERWRHDVDVLLAERDRLQRGRFVDVDLPRQVSVSQLVELGRAPDALARMLSRPVPRPPAPLARRGTAFHAWLEQRWRVQALLDVDELPGAADDGADDADLVALRAAFERSEWARRTPVDVEVPFEMPIGGRSVRGRMDAVFADGDGWTVVDWKTGHRPADTGSAAVQLAAYRLAWARLTRLPDAELHRVRAAFHYVRTGATVEPAGLLDAEGLRRLLAGSDANDP